MSKSISNVHKIAEVFTDYCNNKNYQVEQSEELNKLRIEISNLTERTIVNIYYTGKLLVQGKQNSLTKEIEALKKEFEANPQLFLGDEVREIKACAIRYDIMLCELRTKIKGSLNMLEATKEITESPSSAIEYIAKISRNHYSLTLTQYNNGTLLLQGKTDKIFMIVATW